MVFCEFCKENEANTDTHSGRLICWKCADEMGMCEICGSLPDQAGQREQLHYDELCFK